MGRKIPARKHRTVKDPYVQRAQQFAKVKNKINNPPSKTDVQEIPKSVLRIMQLKEKAKIEKKRVKVKKNKDVFNMKKALRAEKLMPGMDVPEKPLPLIEHNPHQSQHDFVRRVDAMVKDVIRESQFEDKFSVDVKRDDHGNVLEVNRRAAAAKRSKKPKLSAKRKERENRKKTSKEPAKEFPKQEFIEFGNIVHQPPTNLTKPKKQAASVSKDFPKPGKRDLLLKKIIKAPDNQSEVGINLKKKLPKLSSLKKQKVEERRKLVVEAFRQSKKAGVKL